MVTTEELNTAILEVISTRVESPQLTPEEKEIATLLNSSPHFHTGIYTCLLKIAQEDDKSPANTLRMFAHMWFRIGRATMLRELECLAKTQS